MNNDKKFKRAVLVLCILAVCVFYFLWGSQISIQKILSYTPENLVLAALMFFVFYALKSATIFFPILVLEIAVGHLFSTGMAILINGIGLFIAISVPYWIGRFFGMSLIESLQERFPKFEAALLKQNQNSFFVCFLCRIIGVPPGDLVTMYFGASGIPYWKNTLAGWLGVFPGMVLATLFGTNIQDPSSKEFWISFLSMGSMMVLSSVVYSIYKWNQKKK